MAARRTHFDAKHLWLNGTAFLLHRNAAVLEKSLREGFKDETVAIGVVTEGSSNFLRGIQVDREEAEYLLNDFSGFLRLSREQTLVGAFRALVDYMQDLIADVAVQHPESVPVGLREKAKLRRITANELPSKLRQINLKLTTGAEQEFHLLREMRNVLEHNNGLINSETIAKAGAGALGNRLQIDGERVRRALHFARQTAMSLESKANSQQLVDDGPQGTKVNGS